MSTLLTTLHRQFLPVTYALVRENASSPIFAIFLISFHYLHIAYSMFRKVFLCKNHPVLLISGGVIQGLLQGSPLYKESARALLIAKRAIDVLDQTRRWKRSSEIFIEAWRGESVTSISFPEDYIPYSSFTFQAHLFTQQIKINSSFFIQALTSFLQETLLLSFMLTDLYESCSSSEDIQNDAEMECLINLASLQERLLLRQSFLQEESLITTWLQRFRTPISMVKLSQIVTWLAKKTFFLPDKKLSQPFSPHSIMVS